MWPGARTGRSSRAIRGFWPPDGYANKASAKIAYGDIREEKKLIDLYVWIDRHGTNDAVFRFTTDAGLNVTQRFFGCPESLAGV